MLGDISHTMALLTLGKYAYEPVRTYIYVYMRLRNLLQNTFFLPSAMSLLHATFSLFAPRSEQQMLLGAGGLIVMR